MISIANVKVTEANRRPREIYPEPNRVFPPAVPENEGRLRNLSRSPMIFVPRPFGVIEAEDRLYKEWKIAAWMDDHRA